MKLQDLFEDTEEKPTYEDTLHNVHIGHRHLQMKVPSHFRPYKHTIDVNGVIRIPSSVKSHILGLMFIKELKIVIVYGGARHGKPTPIHETSLRQAVEIINKHLKGDRNPHDAQEELIEAGLSAYAKI